MMGYGYGCCDERCQEPGCPQCGSPRTRILTATAPGVPWLTSYWNNFEYCVPDNTPPTPAVIAMEFYEPFGISEEENPWCFYIGSNGVTYNNWRIIGQVRPHYLLFTGTFVGWVLSFQWQCWWPPGSAWIPGGGAGKEWYGDECTGTFVDPVPSARWPSSVEVS